MHTTYILFSDLKNRYYIGFTSIALEDRIRRHLSNHRGFTGSAADWVVVYQQVFESKTEAIQLERKIKKRGAKRFLDNL